MDNRQPNPGDEGRVLITPEDTSMVPFYARISMADNPINQGTPLEKATLLKDATAALYGLDATAVPDEVLVEARSLISTAQSTADSKCKIVSGSYVGTGTYGSDNKNSLTFDGIPKLLIVSSTVSSAYGGSRTYPQLVFVYGQSGGIASLITNGSDIFASATVSRSGNTVSWYSEDASAQQLNVSGTTYNYITII